MLKLKIKSISTLKDITIFLNIVDLEKSGEDKKRLVDIQKEIEENQKKIDDTQTRIRELSEMSSHKSDIEKFYRNELATVAAARR